MTCKKNNQADKLQSIHEHESMCHSSDISLPSHHCSFRADFSILTFNEHLGNAKEDVKIPPNFKPVWVGDQTTIKEFYIEGEPIFGHAYMLIMTYEVHFGGHTVWINNIQLPFFELPQCKGKWTNSIAPIGIELNKNAINTVQIKRNTDRQDNFIIGHVVVHWREKISF